jgi:hypothetical protein
MQTTIINPKGNNHRHDFTASKIPRNAYSGNLKFQCPTNINSPAAAPEQAFVIRGMGGPDLFGVEAAFRLFWRD